MQPICVRCLRPRLYERPITNALYYGRPLHKSPSYASVATNVTPSHSEAQINDDNAHPKDEEAPVKRVRPRSWRTLLKKKSLGRDSSVLVLRDAEGKRSQRHGSSSEKSARVTTESTDSSADKILSSMKEQDSAPTVSEVFTSIQAMHPKVEEDVGAFGGQPLLQLEVFNRYVDKLSESFSQKQLREFLSENIKQNAEVKQRANMGLTKLTSAGKMLLAVNLRAKMKDKHKYIRCISWRQDTTNEELLNEVDHGKRIHKRNIAARIMNFVWGYEVKQWQAEPGSLEIKLNAELRTLLIVGGSNSVLSDLSRRRGIQIEVKGENEITLVANKEKCFGVADELDNLLLQHQIVDLPYPSILSDLNLSHLQDAGRLCGCTATKENSKLVIRGWETQSVQACLRLILAEKPSVHHGTVTYNVPMHKRHLSRTYKCTETVNKEALPHRLRQMNLGRFYLPRKLTAEQQSSLSLKIMSDAPEEDDRKTINTNFLQEPLSDPPPNVKSVLSADFGHLLHRYEESFHPRSLKAKDLANSNVFKFVPAIFGVPQALLSSMAKPGGDQGKNTESLRIRLRVSPWAESNMTKTQNLPDLEMIFGLDDDSTFQPQSLRIRVILRRQVLNIFTPAFEEDLRLVRQDAIFLYHPERQETVQEFIKVMQNAAASFGKVVPPSFLNIRLPCSILRCGMFGDETERITHEAQDDFEANYFVAGISTDEDIDFPYQGYRLSYRRSDGGDVDGNQEGISLSTPVSSLPVQDEGPQDRISDSAMNDFVSIAGEMLKKMDSLTAPGETERPNLSILDAAQHHPVEATI